MSNSRFVIWVSLCVTFVVVAAACGSSPIPSVEEDEGGDTDPAQVQLGERLFLETRFAQFFFANSGGDVNTPLVEGDPVMATSQTAGAPLPGPFRDQSMNCRACHLVDELQKTKGGGVRTYDDFARRSPVPARSDGLLTTPRNSPPLVNATLARDVPLALHFDGEFSSVNDLIIGTFTGRNFGWLPTEQPAATAHLADVIRRDDGKGALAALYASLPYRVAMLGTSPTIPLELVIPSKYRIDVTRATDAEIVQAVAKLVGAYIDSLRFSTDDSGQYNGSPYDVFLVRNHLPRKPSPGESGLAYSQRLLGLIQGLNNPLFVGASTRRFQFHNQPFVFGKTELQGLKIFFSKPGGSGAESGGLGNCVTCHTPPNFTDFKFHNTGASQVEYDAFHGSGAFAALAVPDLATRNLDFDGYLPPSAEHPEASGRFRSPASAIKDGYTDLGVWNVFANPDIPTPQSALTRILCGEFNLAADRCIPAVVLPLTEAYFRTPTVRDLGQSGPYLHNGSKDTIEEVLDFYIITANLARENILRNTSPELLGVRINASDMAPLAAFLRALNEDYN
jgi:cytochrome c peroxidase